MNRKFEGCIVFGVADLMLWLTVETICSKKENEQKKVRAQNREREREIREMFFKSRNLSLFFVVDKKNYFYTRKSRSKNSLIELVNGWRKAISIERSK